MVNANDTGAGRISSMTGYASREGASDGLAWSWELRSVNARGLDLRFRLPDRLGALEAQLRKLVSAQVARGSITVSLRLSRQDGRVDAPLDQDRIELGIARLQQVRAAADQHFVTLHPPTAGEIITLMPESDGAAASALPDAEVFLADAVALIDAFSVMRAVEGAAIAAVLANQLERITVLVDAAGVAAEARAVGQAERLKANLDAVLSVTDAVDDARLAQELALIAVKTDVTEELDRLGAHIDAAVALLDAGGPVGRKLDFLMQEFNREANTLCSKSQDATLTAIGLDLKLAIDQTREQVQNVE